LRVPAAAFGAVTLVEGITGVTSSEHDAARPVALAGEPAVRDPLADLVGPEATVPAEAVLQRHAPAFFQANRFLLRDLVAAVLHAAAPGPAIDLYAGVGLFSTALAAHGHAPVTAVEGDPVSAADLEANARPFEGTLAVERASVESFLRHARPDPRATLIVDPPRTGMSRDALEGLLAVPATRLVYVSCDVATLARDLRMVLDAGYRLVSLEAFDLFPNTAHVETVAVLER
jgi:23S rRNA (uracil1939-C5)-methyltransferase